MCEGVWMDDIIHPYHIIHPYPFTHMYDQLTCMSFQGIQPTFTKSVNFGGVMVNDVPDWWFDEYFVLYILTPVAIPIQGNC